MNLKTHTAYQEIQIASNHDFSVKLYSGKGECLFERTGKAKTNADAKKQAMAIVKNESKKYIKKEK